MPGKSRKAGSRVLNPSKPSKDIANHNQPTSESTPPLTSRAALTSDQRDSTSSSIPSSAVQNMASRTIGRPAPPAVNRKKQKRREKEAAKRVMEQQQAENKNTPQNTYVPNPRNLTRSYFREETDDFSSYGYGEDGAEGDEAFFSGAEDPLDQANALANGFDRLDRSMGDSVSRKKKKAKNAGQLHSLPHGQAGDQTSTLTHSSTFANSQLPAASTLSAAALRSAHENFSHDQIWNTSTQAERENIKQFWLELGEDERRSLVKVEKEAVLRKMKEQQKHSCSCTVCGRKRTAIEEELEVLYDAYYEELEQFANHNNQIANGNPVVSDPRSYVNLGTRRHPMAGQFPIDRGGHDLIEDDEGLEEEEFEDDEEPYSDDDIEEVPRGPPDFFAFGNSLTVKDGILTVADDLLKNDGKHFIDMMESLAEKRMQREQAVSDPHATMAYQDLRQGHNHPPLDEDDDYDEEDDDEDFDSQDEDDLEPDDMSAMTESQRMEEGRRMFQIFAARMFEQRVLTAYREKVARERQRKLIEELEEEDRLDTQKEAKKAKEAARKKEKKKMQKQAKDEERAKKEAEKAAQEAAVRAAEEKKMEEQRQRKEEQRKKREAERKAADEERRRKEAEKQRKAQEERERQQEAERKQREAKEKEKKKREEARKREREEKMVREQEARERKAKEDAARKATEEHVKREREAAANADKEAKERARQEEQARLQAKRTPIAIPSGIYPSQTTAMQSPQLQAVAPVVSVKPQTPAAPRQQSHQGSSSHGSSPQSQQATTTDNVPPFGSSFSSAVQPNAPTTVNMGGKQHSQFPPLHHPQPSAPLSPLNHHPRSIQTGYGYGSFSGPTGNGPASAGLARTPGMMAQMQPMNGPLTGGSYRQYGPPNGMILPPSMNGSRPWPHSSQQKLPTPPGTLPSVTDATPKLPAAANPHSRQLSTSHDRERDTASQPVPISRPTVDAQSVQSTPDKKDYREISDQDVEQLTTRLGSKALLDDSDAPLSATSTEPVSAPGAPGSGRAAFPNFPDNKSEAFQSASWAAFSPTNSFIAPSNWPAPGLPPKGGPGWPKPHPSGANAFGAVGVGAHAPYSPHASRPVAIRLMVVEACKKLSATPGTSSGGFHPAGFLLQQVEQMKPAHEPAISLDEMLEICDTEGNTQNGGGNFVIRNDGYHQGQSIKFEPLAASENSGVKPVGDIGSPVAGHANIAHLGSLAPFGGNIGQSVGGGPHKNH